MRGRINVDIQGVEADDLADLCAIRNAIEDAARRILAELSAGGRCVTSAIITHDRIGRSIGDAGTDRDGHAIRPVALPAPWGRA